MQTYNVSELVSVEEDQANHSCKVVVECDDAIGAGLFVEKLRVGFPALNIPLNFARKIDARRAVGG